MEIHCIALGLECTATSTSICRSSVSMLNVFAVLTECNLIPRPCDPIASELVVSSAPATVEVEEARSLLKTPLHRSDALQRYASKVPQKLGADLVLRPLDAQGLGKVRLPVAGLPVNFKGRTGQSTTFWKGTSKKSERITGMPRDFSWDLTDFRRVDAICKSTSDAQGHNRRRSFRTGELSMPAPGLQTYRHQVQCLFSYWSSRSFKFQAEEPRGTKQKWVLPIPVNAWCGGSQDFPANQFSAKHTLVR